MAIQPLAFEGPAAYDRQALIIIYEQYNAELYRYAYRLTGEAELSEDCVAEVFSRLVRAARDGTLQVDNLRAYLYRMAHNWISDHYRRHPLPPLSLDNEMHADPQPGLLQQVSERMEAEQVQAALLRLPPEQRQVLHLRFVEDWSHQDVAAAIGKSVEATRALQHRALQALKRILVGVSGE